MEIERVINRSGEHSPENSVEAFVYKDGTVQLINCPNCRRRTHRRKNLNEQIGLAHVCHIYDVETDKDIGCGFIYHL